MSIAYIRRAYGVDFKIGQMVRVRPGAGSPTDGCTGKLVRARGHYLVVRGEGWVGNYHPSDVLPATPQGAADHGR